MSRVLHIVPGTDDIANGMAVVARLLAKEQGDAQTTDLKDFLRPCALASENPTEVWVHGMWLPKEWLACWRVLKAGKTLVRMTHGSLSPLYLKHQSPFMKWLVGPIERFFLRRCAKIVATCEAEKGWIEAYLGKKCPAVEVTDIKRFFKLKGGEAKENWRRGILPRQMGEQGATSVATLMRLEAASPIDSRAIHLLYLGRCHPLKGLEYLEAAVAELNSNPVNPVNPVQKTSTRSTWLKTELRIVSNAFGEELEKVWDWCDVLVLPTLSENFGLVIAEALERGKRVITTDGAPAWGEVLTGLTGFTGLHSGYGGRLIYLKGYRDGTDEERVELLKRAIERICK